MLITCKHLNADVVVCGGGPAGCAAAISAARKGKRTILLEYRESLGGLCTNGYIIGIAGVVDGICKEWVDRLDAKGKALTGPGQHPKVEPEYGKLELEQMVLQSGCRLLYGAHVVDCIIEDKKIKSIIVYCKNGKIEISADIFIDCTGDADLAFAAGVPCEVGNAEFMGLNQSVTMGFRLAYVNLKKYREAFADWERSELSKPIEKRRRYLFAKQQEALANGDLHEILSPANLVYALPVGDPECTDVTLDATHTFDCHCDDVIDLSRQIVDQHRKVIWFVDFLKKYVAGFENAVLENMASMNGIRDSRRIVGEYIFTAEDMADARKYDDGIAQHTEFFDAHVATPGVHGATRHIHLDHPIENGVCRPSQDDDDFMHHPFVAMGGYEVRVNPREYCEIPYRSLIPKGVDNLLAAGRCISADYHALGSIRIIAPSMMMGMAAGVGASLTIDNGLNACRDLDGSLVRKALIELGVALDQLPGGMWAERREMPGKIAVNHNDACCIVNDEGDDATRMFSFSLGKIENKK